MKLGPRTVRRARRQRAFLAQIEARARQKRDWILATQAAELRQRAERVIRMR